jgi:glycosyltransferase involved in cell wall biosynthesis
MENDKTEIRSNKKKFTVLFITTGLNTGGAEMMLYNLVSAIDRTKFSSVIISLIPVGDIGKKLSNLDIKVHSLHLNPGKLPSFSALLKLIRLVRKIKPAIIHGWMYHGNLAAQFAKLFVRRKIPIFWTIHHSVDSLENEKRSTATIIKLGARFSRLPASIIYVSSTGKMQHELLGYAKKNSLVISNGVDTDLFSPSVTNRNALRKELQLPETVFLIGNIARFHPMKDHENFLHAAALVQKHNTSVSFVLAGKNVDAQNEDLKRKITELNIQHIQLLGERNDINKILSATDVLVVSSAYGEAFPMIILEAMSCATLCVSTDIGDAAEIIGDAGKIIPAKNPSELAEAVASIIALDEPQRKKMQENARQKILANYSLQHIADAYEKLYEKYLP